jgi:hypothetical protein
LVNQEGAVMATYEITAPDGQKYSVTAPDGATEDQVLAYAKQNMGKQSAMGSGPNSKPKETQPGLKAQGAKLPTAFRGVINAMQGPTFGFIDEIAGGVAAAADKFLPSAFGGQRNPGMGFGDLYSRYRDVARGASEKFQDDNPIVSPLMQIGASLPIGGVYRIADGALPVAAGIGGTVRNAAIVGAGSGAIGGAGNAATFGDIPIEAAKSAAFSAGTSGVMSSVGQAGRSTYRNIVGRREGSRTAQDLARERVAAALARDETTTTQTAARQRLLGSEATIADSAGKNTRDLLDTIATMPGRTADRAEELIRSRQAGRFGRLETAAARSLNTGGARMGETVDAFIEQRATAAAPLYERLHRIGLQPDNELQALLAAADELGATRVGQRIAIADRAPFTLNATQVSAAGHSMRDLDYTKQGLDSLIASKIDKQTGNYTPEGLSLIRLKDAFVRKLDDMTVPAPGQPSLYREARDAYAGPSALIDAVNAGRRAMSQDGESLQRITAGMSASELQAFRVGAFESMRAKIGKEGGQTELLKMWKEPATQEKLRALFPDLRGYREFAAEVAKESRLKGLESVGRGSQTASRNARMDDESAAFLTDALGAGASLKAGNPAGILASVRNLYGRTLMPESVRDDIGQMLMTRGPQAQGLLGDLSRFVDSETERRAAAAARGGLLGSVGIGALQR